MHDTSRATYCRGKVKMIYLILQIIYLFSDKPEQTRKPYESNTESILATDTGFFPATVTVCCLYRPAPLAAATASLHPEIPPGMTTQQRCRSNCSDYTHISHDLLRIWRLCWEITAEITIFADNCQPATSDILRTGTNKHYKQL